MFDFFKPGEHLNTLGLDRAQQLTNDHISLNVPGRMHVTPIDCNRFDYGKPGGGGIGFAVDIGTIVHLYASDKDEITAPDSKKDVIKHTLILLKRIFHYEGGFRIIFHLRQCVREHSGYGSTVQVITSIVQAINIMFGSPLESHTVRRLIGHNFVEQNGKGLAKALETGVGPQVILHGGAAVLGDDLRVIYSGNFFPNHHVAILDTLATRPSHEGPEYEPEVEKSLIEDASYRYMKAYIVLMDLIPALFTGSEEIIGDIFWRFQFSGCNICMLDNYDDRGQKIIDTMMFFRREGILIVGMTSVGPAIYALCDDRNKLEGICSKTDLPYVITSINNKGITIDGKD